MKLLYIIPLALAVILFAFVWVKRNKTNKEKSIRILRIVGIACSLLAAVAILFSYYYSGDSTQLFKLSLPALILSILIFQTKQNKISDIK
jgi:peptidoglycan/LPS O-acetylase OafA/YrhL